MRIRSIFAAVAACIALATSQNASAQDCPCNCYFSGDCEGGQFCDWGVLSNEDSCFWRTPKPQGSPGAGCQNDYNDWGQCDGICAGSSAVLIFSKERLSDLISGMNQWADALTQAAQTGGGYPSEQQVEAIRAIEFKEPRMFDSTWRIVVEVLTMTIGTDVMVFPKGAEEFHSEQAQVKDLSSDPLMAELGHLAIQALLAETVQAGSGRTYMDQARALGLEARLEQGTYDQMCRGLGTGLDCLYVRLADMGDVIGRSGRDGTPETQAATTGLGCDDDPEPVTCMGDINLTGEVDVTDLLVIITRWGPVPDGHAADLDGDGICGVTDLITVIMNWGPCPLQ